MPAVKNVGEPCAGEPHARFDGGREETNDSRQCRATPGASRLPDHPPWLVRWRYCPSGCPRCQTRVSYAFQACPRPSYQAICTLCLGCGYATATYHPWQGPTEPATTGATWTPACPAVQRLRDCIYRPYPAPVGRVNPAG